jgi:hypothetical protein
MIWKPKRGQRVRIHYRASMAPLMPWHGCVGVVVACGGGAGKGPVNAAVAIDGGPVVHVPRGNLVVEEPRG